jgi:hypothetical protein
LRLGQPCCAGSRPPAGGPSSVIPVDHAPVTAYKKIDPAVAGGVVGDPYWMGVSGMLGGEILRSVRFKEEFKRKKSGRLVTTESDLADPSSKFVLHRARSITDFVKTFPM